MPPRPSPRLFSTSAASLAPKGRTPRGSSAGGGDPMDIGTMPAFDLTSLTRETHLKLDKQRDFLHLLRLEQFTFKELASYRQRFVPPSPIQLIKVRHQHYQGESHPASRKVTIEFSPSALPFSSENARRKFRVLVGNRWDTEKDTVKITCELFPNERMNEKWCSDVVDKLIKEAEDPTDPMLDIPLDPRPTLSRLRKSHKKQLTFANSFPKEWLSQSPKTDAKELDELPSAGVGKQGGLRVEGEKKVEERVEVP